jgi:ribosomal protein S27E
MEPGDRLQLDHRDDGPGYLGLAHSSPCRTCGKRCNQSFGGQLAAKMAGKESRDRRCAICGKPFHASQGNDGRLSATCSNQGCITQLRRVRKSGAPDPEPPAATGRAW